MRVACILFKHEVRLAEFAQACLRFSPQIALAQPNVVLIEIGKCKILYSEQSFLARIQVLLRRFNYSATLAIGDEISAALTFARYGVQSIDLLPIQALGDFADPFSTDPIGREWIGKMIESLNRLGIKSIAQFKTLPIQQFPSRFGSLGLHCRQQVEKGNDYWPYWEPPRVFSERVELLDSEFCSDLEPLLFKAKTLLHALFSRLRGQYLRADQIQFSLELEKYSTVKAPSRCWNFELMSPQGSSSGFLPILRERLNWDLQKNPIESYVTAMKVEVLSTSIGSSSQKDFFQAGDECYERMGSFFGQMEEFLGKGKVFWASVTEERFPEKSWIRKRMPEEQKVSLLKRYPKRPSRIFKNPIPIQLIDQSIYFKRRSFRIRQWSPVERLSLDWVDDMPSRNYYCIDLEKGSTLWIFTDPGHNYFLHGYYE